MTVRELMQALSDQHPDAEVWVEAGGDGAIHEGSLKGLVIRGHLHVVLSSEVR